MKSRTTEQNGAMIMKQCYWQLIRASVAGVFLLALVLTPRSADAFDSSDYDSGQDTADLLMWGALGVVAVALIIQIAKADSEPSTPDEDPAKTEDDAPEAERRSLHLAGDRALDPDSISFERRGVTIQGVGKINQEGALIGIRLAR
jgi:hypothetical protein